MRAPRIRLPVLPGSDSIILPRQGPPPEPVEASIFLRHIVGFLPDSNNPQYTLLSLVTRAVVVPLPTNEVEALIDAADPPPK